MEKMRKLTGRYYVQLYRNKFGNLESGFPSKNTNSSNDHLKNQEQINYYWDWKVKDLLLKKVPDLDSFTDKFLTVFKNQFQGYRKSIQP